MNSDFSDILNRGVQSVVPSKDGLASLMQQRKIKLYLGIDPTGSQLTLGHAVVLKKLQQFVEAGHEVVLLIGNGTVKIGDPTGKDATRPLLTDTQINEHFKDWQQQAGMILDFDRIQVVRNGDWLEKLGFSDFIGLMSKMTVSQMLERDMFQERLAADKPIHLHELIYPLLQGYDSVVMEVDLEIGGNDQLFNMMVGRTLLAEIKGREKYVLTTPLLVGSDGRKMGKSLHNFIPLQSTPQDLFGQLMSITDEVMTDYFKLLTDVPSDEISKMEQELAEGKLHPMTMKKRLALEITSWLHGQQAAAQAQDFFASTVQEGEIPADLPILSIGSDVVTLLDVVMQTNVLSSRSDGRRLIEQGGVELNNQKKTDVYSQLNLKAGDILRIGKRNYFKLA